MSNPDHYLYIVGRQAKEASKELGIKSSEEKSQALLKIAESIENFRDFIKTENLKDIEAFKSMQIKSHMLDRLILDDMRIDAMIKTARNIALMPDPVGKLITSQTLENGLLLNKIRVPLGVIALIFESRPNVCIDAASLCIKSGNALILRGGKEAENSNKAIIKAINEGLERASFAPFCVQQIEAQDRDLVKALAQLDEFIDLIIPRGGEGLIKTILDVATVPVIKNYKGICHLYVDAKADIKKALSICHNAKCSRPSVCNACEKILIHEKIAKEFLPKLYKNFLEAGVEMRGDDASRGICPNILVAHENDWETEYLDLIVTIKVISDMDEAILHINNYGSHHSDAIITEDIAAGREFLKRVDSAAVYLNASTRLTDGFVFGLGAEMGISTDKLHARGPMGLQELCTYKWVGYGSGQVR